MRPLKKPRAFSLTELLVVIAIILILVAFIVVSVHSVYQHANQVKCQSQMEQIWHACVMYSSKYRGMLPAAWDIGYARVWYDTLKATRYIDNPAALACPLSDIATTSTTGGASPSMPTEMKNYMRKSLDWFKANQRGDGGWSAASGHADQDCGITSFAVLCFLGYGCTETYPAEYADCVRKGYDYLIANQQTDGKFTGTYIDYTQGLCTMALCDGLTMGIERLRPAAQKAFDYLVDRQARQSYGGFTEAGNANDMSATGWGYQGLVSGKRAGLTPSGSYPSGYYGSTAGLQKNWTTIGIMADTMFRLCIQINQSSLGYDDDYRTVYCFNPLGYDHYNSARGSSAYSQYRMTAVNLGCRMLWGHRPTGNSSPRTYSSNENCYNQLQWLTRTESGQTDPEHIRVVKGYVPPAHGGVTGCDLYAVYYQTIAMWLTGGNAWEQYKPLLIQQLTSRQQADGSFALNYAPYAGDWGGSAYPTALGALTMEVAAAEYIQGTRWSRPGDYSYGYNPKLGLDRMTPAPDTIVLVDYTRSLIDETDPSKYAAPRHGGKMNALFADGRVLQLGPNDIKTGMLTPRAGD